MVTVIPGDDAAPEAMEATLSVLAGLDLPIDWNLLPTGREIADRPRTDVEEEFHAEIDKADAVLFGSTNGTSPGPVYMRWGKQTFANVRPVRWRKGFRSPMAHPEGIDYTIVRENLEDAYIGVMGDVQDLLDAGLAGPRARLPRGTEGRFAAKIITREGTEQVGRFACELARSRKAKGYPGKLTVSAKTNMLPKTDKYFCSIVEEICREEFPDLVYEQFIVDDMAHRLVLRPQDLDVLLLPNLYGDLLSDEGAATIGGLGLAPSGCYGDDFAYFESAHGTAPDIAGQNLINPTASLLSGLMMLEHMGFAEAAERCDDAITRLYAAEDDRLTVDQGGRASTSEFADHLLAEMT